MTFFRLVILTFFVTLSCNANANRIQDTLYFELSTGQEIRVDITGETGFPRFLIYNDSGHSDTYVFKEYIRAARDKQGYRYVDIAPCEDCYTSLSLIRSASLQLAQESDEAIQTLGSDSIVKASKSGAGKARVKEDRESDYFNTFVNSAIVQTGSRTIDTIFDFITNNKDAETSPYHILRSENGYPVSFLVVVEDKIMEEVKGVTFTRIDGGWAVEYPATGDTTDRSEYNKRVAIETAITAFIIDYSQSVPTTTCTTGYTGPTGYLRAQRICYIAR